MDQKVLLISFALLLPALLSVDASEQEGAVIVYASRFIRPSSTYEVFLSSSETKVVRVEATIQSGDRILVSNAMAVQAGKRMTLPLQVGPMASTNPYSLKLSATSPSWQDTRISELELLVEEFLVLIQLDQPIYKPGDIINYRVLVLNSSLKLDEKVGTIDVRLREPPNKDQKDSVTAAQQHLKVQHKHKGYPGYFEGFFGLPNFDLDSGTWIIEVAGSNIGAVQKTFHVANYTLPFFSLDVTPPLFVEGKRSQYTLELIIEMKDSIGSPLVGNVVVELDSGVGTPKRFSHLVVEGIKQKDYELDLRPLYSAYCYLSKSTKHFINVTVTGVESFTQKSVTVQKMVPYFCHAFRMTMTLSSHHFRPGAETNATIRLSTHDGKKYVLPPGYTWTSEKFTGTVLTDDEDSEDLDIMEPILINDTTVILPFRSPSNAKSVEITVEFDRDTVEKFTFRGRSGHAELTMDISRTYREGEILEFSLGCTQACSQMEYAIVAKKGVLNTETVRMTGESSGPLRMNVTSDMVPQARIVAYYLKGTDIFSTSGEIRVQESSITNDVKVLVQPTDKLQTHLKPGNTTVVQVTAKPNSLVGLLAIDKSLLQLKKGNDITATEVISKYRKLSPAMLDGTVGDPAVCAQENAEEQCFWSKQTAAFTEANLVLHLFHANASHHPPREQEALVRMDFRDSFLFTTNFTDTNGQCSFLSTVPDSITTWSITAFSASTKHALGLTTIPAEVKVYQDFFISMDLPYNLIEHESGFVNVTVFNLREQYIKMGVFVEVSTVPPFQKLYPLPESSQRAQYVRFPLGPFREGDQMVKVTLLHVAPTSKVLDQVLTNVSVIHSGAVGHWTSDVKRLINGITEIPVEHVDVERTVEVVQGSSSCQLHIYGDSLGVAVRELSADEKTDIFFRTSADSAEQIMARFMGSLFWLKFLDLFHNPSADRGALEEEAAYRKKKDELLNNLRNAHKRLSKFRLSDGSYNTLGRAREPGSTWLTACAVQGQVLVQNAKYDDISINSNQWEHSLSFLESTLQQDDGSFQERGVVVDKAYQGGAGKNPALSAFVVLAYVEAGISNAVVRRAENYLKFKIQGRTPISPHALAVVCYALGRLHSTESRHCIQRLEEVATVVPGKKYWNATAGGKIKPALDTETTAYALLALHSLNYTGDLSLVINWLSSQRHNAGKFKPTQDKVMILRAFGQVAKDHLNSDKPLDVDVHADGAKVKSVTISPYDTEPKYLALPQDVRKVTLRASGKGIGRAQIQCKYNKVPSSIMPVPAIKKVLEANIKLQKFSNEPPSLALEVCVRYHGSRPSGMVTVDIPALSGFKFQKGDESEKEDLSNAKTTITESGAAQIDIIEIANTQPVCMKEILTNVNNMNTPPSRIITIYLQDDPKVEALVEYSLRDVK